MSRPDPDLLAALEEERDFLLTSLDDLEAEHDAGDLDDHDYRALKGEYTARAAHTIRAMGDHTLAVADLRPPRSWSRVTAWTIGVIVVAALAGVLLARASGSRTAGGTITGDIRTTTRQQLFDAQQTFAAGDLEGAMEIYEEVLESQPSNVEALTYRGWLSSRTGDQAGAAALLDDAIEFDPEYPDARIFRAIVALDLGDPVGAAEQLAAFDGLDPPAFAEQLLSQAQVRERIAAGGRQEEIDRVTGVLIGDEAVSFDESGLAVTDVIQVAELLAARGDILTGLELFRSVLRVEPDDVEALTYLGWLVARGSGEDGQPAEELLESGLGRLDAALDIDPAYPPALVFSAFVHSQLGDIDAAREDLAAFDVLDEQPPELVELIGRFGLRDVLAG
ncbi:MAG: tetratricopeptide repeat protein [Acidimicrobiales bacterium]